MGGSLRNFVRIVARVSYIAFLGSGLNHTAAHRSERSLQCSITIRMRVLCNSRSLLKESVFRTRFAHHWRSVLFNRSIWLVSPDSFGTGRCLLEGRTQG